MRTAAAVAGLRPRVLVEGTIAIIQPDRISANYSALAGVLIAMRMIRNLIDGQRVACFAAC